MLVFCVGMYRACSTWQYGVAGAILEKHRAGRRLGFVAGIYLNEKVDLDAMGTDWAVLKAHDAHDRLGAVLGARRGLGLYAHRDIEDVVFSYMHVTGKDFDAVMEQGFVELCLNNDRFWRAQPGMLVQRYDDLIAEPVRGVAEIAAHLGVTLEDGEATAIAETLSWEASHRKLQRMAGRLEAGGVGPNDEAGIDAQSLLHWNHIRSTNPAETRRRATPRQQALIAAARRGWFEAQGLVDPEAPGVESAASPNPEPIPLIAHVSSGADVRIDRYFRGVRDFLLDFDAPFPRLGNPSYLLFRREWRCVNVGTTAAPRDRFVPERPTDLNLAIRPDPATGYPLERLAAEHRLLPPRVVIFNPTSDVRRLAEAVLALGWRPELMVVDQDSVDPESPPWAAVLAGGGYLPVPGLVGPRFYIRDDLAAAIPALAAPLGPHVVFRLADGSDVPAEPAPSFDAERATWQAERAAWDGERDAWRAARDSVQAERDAWQAERDAWQGERDARQRERDEQAAARDRRERVLAEARAGLDRALADTHAVRAERDRWMQRSRAARHRLHRADASIQNLQEHVDQLRDRLASAEEARRAEAQAAAAARRELEVGLAARDARPGGGWLGRLLRFHHRPMSGQGFRPMGRPRPARDEADRPVG